MKRTGSLKSLIVSRYQNSDQIIIRTPVWASNRSGGGGSGAGGGGGDGGGGGGVVAWVVDIKFFVKFAESNKVF